MNMLFQAEFSKQAEMLLDQSTDAQGRRLKVTRVPVPPPQFITPAEEAGTEVKFSQNAEFLIATHLINVYIHQLCAQLRRLQKQSTGCASNAVPDKEVQAPWPLSNSFRHCLRRCGSQDEDKYLQGELKKRKAGDRLPASYINFVRVNGGAVIPTFGAETDERSDTEALSPFAISSSRECRFRDF